MNKKKVQSGCTLKGIYTLIVLDQFGKIKNEIIIENVITTAIRSSILDYLTSETPTLDILLNYIAVGTGTNAPAEANTTLQTELARKLMTSRTSAGVVGTASTLFAAGEATGTIKEVGVFANGTASADSGTLVSRSAVDIVVGALDSLFVDWQLTLSDA